MLPVTTKRIHFQYDLGGMAEVLIDGIILGVARLRTRSVLLTMLLHGTGNAFVVAQNILLAFRPVL